MGDVTVPSLDSVLNCRTSPAVSSASFGVGGGTNLRAG